jgi:manganese/zinc/iron transport system permease protein
LVVALLIIPAASARFWSHRLGVTLCLATVLGAASGWVGVAASALFPKLPAGAVIVLAAIFCFGFSLVFGARRGLVVRWLEHHRVSRRVARQHLLRAIYEWCEADAGPKDRDSTALLERNIPLESLRSVNDWNPSRLRHLLRLGLRERLLNWNDDGGTCHLSPEGKIQARRVTRNHRLWETYLLNYADVAPQHVHHNADQIEHVIEPAVVNELEELLAMRGAGVFVPLDPETAERHLPLERTG